MRKFLTPVAISIALSFGAAQSQVQKKTPQQDKSAMCEKAAANRKGDERKAFIKTCLAAKSEPEQNKVASCESGSRAEDL